MPTAQGLESLGAITVKAQVLRSGIVLIIVKMAIISCSTDIAVPGGVLVAITFVTKLSVIVRSKTYSRSWLSARYR